ncbi:MAG TPA: (d)CMP kinase, partial [Terriglobia bacterium]|nr:(d)CMP kinase [Terriglobia bacterium]
IGTVVFPDADVKIFLDAAPEVRGQRRWKDKESAAGVSAERVAQAIAERDRRDQTRAASPLVPAPDAVRIDTTHLTAEQVAERILEMVRTRRGGSGMESDSGDR